MNGAKMKVRSRFAGFAETPHSLPAGKGHRLLDKDRVTGGAGSNALWDRKNSLATDLSAEAERKKFVVKV